MDEVCKYKEWSRIQKFSLGKPTLTPPQMLWSSKLPKDHSIVISEIFTMAVTFELSTIMRLYETIREMPQIPPTLAIHGPGHRGGAATGDGAPRRHGCLVDPAPRAAVGAVWQRIFRWPGGRIGPGSGGLRERRERSCTARNASPSIRGPLICGHKHRQDWTVLESQIKPSEPKLSVQLLS